MKISFCDCGCPTCRKKSGPHLSCDWECEEVIPKPQDRKRVLGGKPGREIIAIE